MNVHPPKGVTLPHTNTTGSFPINTIGRIVARDKDLLHFGEETSVNWVLSSEFNTCYSLFPES